MTGETSPTSPETPDQAALVGQAIETLTALARQTRVRGAGTPSAAVEPVDFADLAASASCSPAGRARGRQTWCAASLRAPPATNPTAC